MTLHTLKSTLAVTAVLVLSATVSGAATFSLNTINGTSKSLPANYSLAVPVTPHDIFSFQDTGSGFGGLLLTEANSNTRLTYTFIGSEAGPSNAATLNFGADSF